MRLATFNVENLGRRGPRMPSPAARAAVLRPQLERLRADVLCVQEVDATKVAGERRPLALEHLVQGTSYEGHALLVSTTETGMPSSIHNLAVLTRLPVISHRFLRHRLVPPPLLRTARPGRDGPAQAPVEWERPVQHVVLALSNGQPLHVFHVHLRSPRASHIPGGKADHPAERTTSSWAQGFFVSAIKRTGQALEARLAIDQVFAAEPDALIAVCGDFNAEDRETPLRLVCAGEDDTGSGLLAPFALTPVARSLSADRRFTIIHHGRPQMLDHILLSRNLFAALTDVEVHNEMLEDELVSCRQIERAPESTHAPLVAAFDIH